MLSKPHRVAGIERKRHAVQGMQGRRPAAFDAVVLDIVVNQQGVVQ